MTTTTHLGRTRPLCSYDDPELWYSPDPDERALAKTVCLRCPLRRACLTAALDAKERFGVWGGLDASERRWLAADDARWVDDEGRLRLACGTEPALRAHGRYAETCETCTAAHAARTEAARRARLAAAHAAGGTETGYLAHRLLGETVCPRCQAAHRRASKEQRRRAAARAALAAGTARLAVAS
ncbi:WhiB family transcriptional regulator [Streptomyces chrestomyceticus]|uniref:WhiB family transcriptional regulator n=1 Tax=Streptomyces chrestomyceticus TaxID=68185 RepID=UPI0033D4E68E